MAVVPKPNLVFWGGWEGKRKNKGEGVVEGDRRKGKERGRGGREKGGQKQ